ncbi:MAG: hypothetical protein ACIAS6_01050 [Phycisphaerales bacterium JB060]
MSESPHAIEVPVDECYVAVAPKPPGRITGRVAAYAVEGQLPRPIDELCIAWRATGDQLVVVAVDQERADQWLADGVLSARVTSVPDDVPVDTGPIELLRGTHLPSRIRRHRHHRLATIAALLVLACLALAYGLHDRTSAIRDHTRTADAAVLELARAAMPQWRDGDSPRLVLTGELRRLHGLASDDRQDEPIDSRTTLAALFEAWPEGEGFQAESIEAAANRVTLRSIAPSREAAIAMAGRLAEDGFFEPALPQVQTEPQRGGDVTRLEVSLTRTGSPR